MSGMRRTLRSCRENEYNSSKNLTLRTSCPEIRGLTTAYASLLELAQEFERSNTPRFLTAAFGTNLTDLTSTFDAFSKQAVSTLSTVRKGTLARHFGPASLLYQRAETFARRWTTFIELVNDLGSRGISGYEPEIREAFSTLFSTLSFLETRMKRKGYTDKDVLRFINVNRTHFRAIERRLGDIMIISQESIVCDIKTGKYTGFLRNFVIQMNTVLDRVLPRDVFAPVESGKVKVDVSVACAVLGQIICAFRTFPTQISALKTQIIALNTEVSRLNSLLNLPFAVILTLEELPVSPMA